MVTDTRECPFCSEPIKAAAKKCRYCGEWLDGYTRDSILGYALPGDAPGTIAALPSFPDDPQARRDAQYDIVVSWDKVQSFRGFDLARRNLSKLILMSADLSDADLNNADLRVSNLAFSIMTGADLRKVDLRGATLTSVNLSNADLQGADLRFANLENAVLIGANLRDARLSGVRLDNADLTDANLTNAELNSAWLSGATLTEEQLDTVKSLSDTRMPDGTKHD